MPQNSVHAIAQTPDGFLWLGTEEGLARFDGVHFQVFTRANSDGLPSDYIGSLAVGRDGTLWIGTDSGLSSLAPMGSASSSSRFRTMTEKDGLASDNINLLCVDRDGAVWVGTSRGLNRIVDGRAENWTSGKGLADPSVTALLVDRAGTLWVGTSKGLSRLDGKHFVTLTAGDGLPSNAISALAAGTDGSIWVGTLKNGLAQIQQGHISRPDLALPWNQIHGLFVDKNGGLWIVFDRNGIGRLYRGRLELDDSARGLPSDRCTGAMFEDREGSLWIGSLDAGVVQLRDAKFTLFGKPEGLSGNYIGNVLQAQDGSMWIGADSNGLNHLLSDGRVELWGPGKGLPSQAVYSLLQSRDGSMWIGYRDGSLAHIRDGQVSVYRDPAAANASLNALFEDRQGRIWVGSFGKGLARFEQGKFEHVSTTERISVIAQTPDGALWVATDGSGLERILNGSMTRFTVGDGLPSDHIMCVYAGADGAVWVGTASGGLSRIRDNRIVSWTTKQGLSTSTVGAILEDNFGDIWFGSDDGIFRVPRDQLNSSAGSVNATLHPVQYGSADGLRSRETLYGGATCAWKDRDGRLWFATIKGVARIDPAHIPIDTVAPPVQIAAIEFNSQPVALQNEFRLGPGSGNLHISFTAPSFVAPERMNFRYRLSGIDTSWIDSDSSRSAWYTNLPPGKYLFEVQAANSDGVWNRTGASINFAMRPALTRTPLAYICYALLALLLVWGAVTLRTLSLTRRQQELTRTVAERTAQLESEKRALEEARRELQIQATHDALTGLFNRGAMFEHLQREMARAIREHTILTIIIADLDYFKQVNDEFGHLCGDDIIREVAERFRKELRGYDIAGRYGGEEFLILFPNFDPRLNMNRVDDLLQAIGSRPFVTEEAEVRLTCSFGVGTFRPGFDFPDIREVLRRADAALYVAKDSGRNCARVEYREPHGKPADAAPPNDAASDES